MLLVKDLITGYGTGDMILKGVTFQVERNQVVALLGRNGVGKTTTVRAIMGLLPVKQGEIYFMNRAIHRLRPEAIARLGIALIPQGRKIFPSLTVKENLLISARKPRVWRLEGDRIWDLTRIYELFPVLEERSNIGGTKLSGGEQQMLAIARALMMQPMLLLADEPTEGLSPMMVNRIAKTFIYLKELGQSILLIEHNLDVALSIADYVYVMDNGCIVYEGRSHDLAENRKEIERLLGIKQ